MTLFRWKYPPVFSFSGRRKRENGPCTVQKRKRRRSQTAPAVWDIIRGLSFAQCGARHCLAALREGTLSLQNLFPAKLVPAVSIAGIVWPLLLFPLAQALFKKWQDDRRRGIFSPDRAKFAGIQFPINSRLIIPILQYFLAHFKA